MRYRILKISDREYIPQANKYDEGVLDGDWVSLELEWLPFRLFKYIGIWYGSPKSKGVRKWCVVKTETKARAIIELYKLQIQKEETTREGVENPTIIPID